MASVAKQLFTYKNRVLTHFGSTLGYDSDGAGTKVDYSGTFDAPSGRRMRSIKAQQNFYFTTDEGIKRLDSLTGTPTKAGAPKALDGTATLAAAGSGFMAVDNQIAYRIVWGFKDANDNLILGTPSQRILVTNPAAGTADDIDLTFVIPDGVTTSFFYQVYRTGESGGDAVEPNDECQLVNEASPTAAEISAEEVTLTDTTPNALRGASLYTNPSQQGIANANDVPPLAKDITVYKNHALYANTQTKQRFSLTLIAVGSDDLNLYDYTGDTSSGTDTILNMSSIVGLAIGQKITGTDIPADTLVTNVAGTTVTMDKNATGTTVGLAVRFRDRLTLDGEDFWANDSEVPGSNFFLITTGGTPGTNIADTAQSLVKIINKSATNIYAFYVSNFDDLPGMMLIEDRSFGGMAWDATSSKGGIFTPVLPETGSTVQSSNETRGNRVYISKPSQPEAVPILQYLDVGSENDDIERIVALRDSVFVLKKDGVFRWIGDDATNFRVTLFDNTAIIIGPDTADTLNNQVFAYSNQGTISISDNGVQVLSRPIELDLLKISSDSFPDFASIAFGVGYESERKYLLYVPIQTSDTFATQAYVYNTFTSSWTRWEEDRTCGVINQGDDRLYLGQGGANHVRKERKTLTVTDYSEDEFSLTVVSSTDTTIEVNSTSDAVIGQTIAQLSSGVPVRQAVVTEVTDATHLEVDRTQLWEVAAATLYDPIDVEVQWAPIHGGNPGIVKQFPEVSVFFREAIFRTIDLLFSSNFSDISAVTSISPIQTGAFGVGPFGQSPWGGGPPDVQPIRTYLPLEQQRAHWIDMQIEHSEALTLMAIAGYSMPSFPVSERFT